MRLKVHQIHSVKMLPRLEEVVEAHLEEIGRRRVTGDVAAQFGGSLVGAGDHGQGVPTDGGHELFFQLEIAGVLRLITHGNRISIGCDPGVRRADALGQRMIGQSVENILGATLALQLDDAVEGIEPFMGFIRIGIHCRAGGSGAQFALGSIVHRTSTTVACINPCSHGRAVTANSLSK